MTALILPRRHLELTSEEVDELVNIAQKDPRAYMREKANALLAIARGYSPHLVATSILARLQQRHHPETIYIWLDDYLLHRKLRPQAPRRRSFPPEDPERERVLDQIHQPPPTPERGRWTLELLRKYCDPLRDLRTVSGVARRLKRWRVRWKRGRLHVTSPDPNYVDKMKAISTVLDLARADPETVSVLYADETTCHRQPFAGNVWHEQGAAGQNQPTAPCCHASNSVRRIVGTLDATTGRVLYRANAKIGVSQLAAFLKYVRKAYGPDRRIVLVWDNWPIHFYDNVVAAAEQARIEILRLPTYAPWTNPIEKLWRKLKQDVLCMHRLSGDWKALKEQVHQFLDRYDRTAPDLLRYVGIEK